MPAFRLCQQQMACEHHDKVNGSQDEEHFVDTALAKVFKECLHNGAGNGFCAAESCHGQSGGQTFLVLEPEHQGLYRG